MPFHSVPNPFLPICIAFSFQVVKQNNTKYTGHEETPRLPLFFVIVIQINLLPAALIQQLRRHPPHHTHARDRPPAKRHHAPVQAHAVPPPAHNGPHGAEPRRHGLAQPMNGAQHRRMRRAVVEQNDTRRQGHGARRRVQEQNHHNGEPQRGRHARGRAAAVAVLAGGGRRLLLREHGQKGREQVRHGKDDEEVAEAAESAEAGVHGRVHDHLEEHAQDAEDRGRVADGGGGHAEPAGEPEEVALAEDGGGGAAATLHGGGVGGGHNGGGGGGGKARPRGGQEQGPDVGEGAEVEIVQGLGEQREDDVAGPQTAKGKRLLLLAAIGRGGRRRRRLLLVQWDRRVELFVAGARVVHVVQGSAEEEALDARGHVQPHVICSLFGLGCLCCCTRVSLELAQPKEYKRKRVAKKTSWPG